MGSIPIFKYFNLIVNKFNEKLQMKKLLNLQSNCLP